jgi:hypothetical protein
VGGGGWVKILIEQKVISGKDQAHIDWVVREWSKTPTHVLQGITRMLAGADITPLLSQVRVPTLVIAPSRSPLTSLTDQITVRNSIPDARMAVVHRRRPAGASAAEATHCAESHGSSRGCLRNKDQGFRGKRLLSRRSDW